MRNVYIHIGLHKTATTSLQRQFFSNISDITYFNEHHKKFARRILTQITIQDPIFFDAQSIKDYIATHCTDSKPLLISAEAFSGALYAGMGKRGLDHRSAILQNLKSAFPNAGIVLVIRRQDQFAASCYRQYLKSGGTERIEDFYGINSKKRGIIPFERFTYHKYIQYLVKEYNGKVLVLTFEEFNKNRSDFFTKLCAFLEINFIVPSLTITNATRLGEFGMRVTRILNRFFRSALNTEGPFPGLLLRSKGKWIWKHPSELLHDRWISTSSNSGNLNYEDICNTIFEGCIEDNKKLDDEFHLGLSQYGYY